MPGGEGREEKVKDKKKMPFYSDNRAGQKPTRLS